MRYYKIAKNRNYDGIEKLNYSAILTPLIILSLALLLYILAITMNDIGHGYAFGLNSTSKADFSFAAVGDWGCSANTKKMIHNIIDKESPIGFRAGRLCVPRPSRLLAATNQSSI